MTHRKAPELDLQRSEERIRAFIKNSTEAIWCIELEQPIAIDLPEDEQIDLIYKYAYLKEANDAYARAAGYERGRRCWDYASKISCLVQYPRTLPP